MTTYKLTHTRVTWTNIVNPNPADIQNLSSERSHIHPLNLEDMLSRIERPKLDLDDEYLFVVLHFPQWDKAQRLTRAREVDIIMGRGYVVTLHDGSLKPLNQLYDRCQNDPEERERILGKSASHTFYTIIDRLVDYILPILTKVDVNIRAIEEGIFTANTRQVIQEITLVRRDIIALRRIIRQQVPVLDALERADHAILHEELEEYFGDIADHIHRARDIIDEDAEIIGSLAETADTLASHRINEVMRILTVFSVVMLPLTLISSIYGMNFAHLPFDDHRYGFTMITILMVVVAILMLIYFRRRKWL